MDAGHIRSRAVAALALLLASCTCGGDDAAPAPDPTEAREPEPAPEDDPPLWATDEPIELAIDEGESLLVAAGGRLVRVPKAGGEDRSPPPRRGGGRVGGQEAATLLSLDGRVIRDVARLGDDRVAVLSYPLGDTGPRSVSPPGDLRVFTLGGDAPPRVLIEEASISVQVAARAGELLVLDDPDAWTARVRTYDADALEVRQQWSMRGRGLPSVLLADDRGAYVGLESLSEAVAIGLHPVGAEQHAPPLFGGPVDTELALAGDDLLALVAGAEPAVGPTGAATIESPGALMAIDRESFESGTLTERAFRNARDLVVGPRHACVVEHFPERLAAHNHDVWAIPLNGEDPAVPIVERLGDARCLVVDDDAAFLATPRGVERFAITE